MTELEQKLRAAMHAAVDDEQPPRDLTTRAIRRHQRRTTMLASLSVVVSAAVAIAVLPVALSSHGGPPPGSSPLGPGHPTSELHGAAMPRGSDVRLLYLYDASRLAWYSTATRRTSPIAGLPRGEIGFGPIHVQGGYVLGEHQAGPPASGSFYYVADGAIAATRLGIASSAAPSSGAGAIWLITFLQPGRPNLSRAQLTGLDGRPIGRPVTLPTDFTILAGVGTYLELVNIGYGVGTPGRLWDPASRRVVHTRGDVMAAGPEQVAWERFCDGCPLHVFDARTGHTTTITTPPGSWVVANSVLLFGSKFSLGGAKFSPDGTMLAVELNTGTDGHRAPRAGRLAVIDLATGRMIMVPGVDLTWQAAGSLGFDWQSGTRRLVLTLPDAHRANTIQVGYWQPGAARLRLTTARAPRNTVYAFVQ